MVKNSEKSEHLMPQFLKTEHLFFSMEQCLRVKYIIQVNGTVINRKRLIIKNIYILKLNGTMILSKKNVYIQQF